DSIRACRFGATCQRAGNGRPTGGEKGASGFHSQINHARLPLLFGRRQEIQVAAPALGDARHDAGSIPREVEPADRLSDGRGQLRGAAFRAGEANRVWSKAQECRAAPGGLYRRAAQAWASREGWQVIGDFEGGMWSRPAPVSCPISRMITSFIM